MFSLVNAFIERMCSDMPEISFFLNDAFDYLISVSVSDGAPY